MQVDKKTFPCRECGSPITGTNCAYELSFQNQWKSAGDKDKLTWWCKFCSQTPINAKQVRTNIFRDKRTTSDKDSKVDAFIYCEVKGGGHVYKGTYDKCVQGNGTTAKDINADLFEQYDSITTEYLKN